MSKEPGIRFGTDGWRAVMCDTFTFANVRLVCQAIAEHLKELGLKTGVVVAHDARFLAERFAREAAEVMLGNDIPVWLPEEDVPTPVAAHAVLQLGAAGAIMFTASHNPPEYNGIKFIPAYGGPASLEVTSSIERYLSRVMSGDTPVQRKSLASGAQNVQLLDPRPSYSAALRELVDFSAIRQAELKVAYDAMYGSGRAYVGGLLEETGAEVTALHTWRDPLFGGASPEPLAAHLPELVNLTRTGQVDLGLATDGDADRFGVIDSDGTYLSPNEVISLLIPYLVQHRGMRGSVVRTVATTHLIDRLAAYFGLTVHETPVGFKHVCEKMLSEPVLIGGEESGGLSIGGHIPEKDGVLANLLVAEVRAVTGITLGEYLGAWAQRVGPAVSRRIDLRFPDEKKAPLLSRLQQDPPERLGPRQIERVITVDGAKFVLADGSWILVRASGTEPLLRIYLEATNSKALSELEADARHLVTTAV